MKYKGLPKNAPRQPWIHPIPLFLAKRTINVYAMDPLSSYNIIIEASVIIILSFWFNGISKKTNIPSVLMLIILGLVLQFILGFFMTDSFDFSGGLEILGIVGLIMIVLEAALELELRRDKIVPILKPWPLP